MQDALPMVGGLFSCYLGLLLNAGTQVNRLGRAYLRGCFLSTPVGQAAFLHRSKLTGLDAPSFNHQFVVGENESILIGLRPALGLGLLRIGPQGLN